MVLIVLNVVGSLLYLFFSKEEFDLIMVLKLGESRVFKHNLGFLSKYTWQTYILLLQSAGLTPFFWVYIYRTRMCGWYMCLRCLWYISLIENHWVWSSVWSIPAWKWDIALAYLVSQWKKKYKICIYVWNINNSCENTSWNYSPKNCLAWFFMFRNDSTDY